MRIKMKASNEEEARKVQDYMFKNGFRWRGSEGEYRNTDCMYFFASSGCITYDRSDAMYFDQHPNVEVFLPEETEIERPPIGLAPTYIWKALRVKDILAAMVRYHEAGKVIPDAWINELVELQPKEGV